jgi:hypothetical protein
VVALYAWDRFITVSIVANICALIWLAWVVARPDIALRQRQRSAPG